MKQPAHPYQQFKNTATWKAIDRSIRKLVSNGDLQEQTYRSYIVGYLCAELAKRERDTLTSKSVPAPRRGLAARIPAAN